jgi:CBS domain-containing protein
MLVKDIMTRTTRFVPCTASLREAGEVMQRDDIGFLPVRDGGQLVGVVTDRDLITRGATHDGSLDDLTVKDVMTPQAHAVRANLPLAGAARAMKLKGVRRLLVIDDTQQLVGVVSVGDLAERGAEHGLASKVLAHLATSPPSRQPSGAHA